MSMCVRVVVIIHIQNVCSTYETDTETGLKKEVSLNTHVCLQFIIVYNQNPTYMVMA